MSLNLVVATVALVVGSLAGPSAQQSDPAVALRQAMDTETVRGDVPSAIAQYRLLARSTNRAVAVQALLRLAGCYEKIGDGSQARVVYEQIVQEFDDQPEAVSTARAKLAAAAIRMPTNPTPRLVMTGGVESLSQDGRFALVAKPGELGVRNLLTGAVNWLQLGINHFESALLSPDVSRIAFVGYPQEGGVSFNIVANQVGAKPRVLIERSEFDYFITGAWSRDGGSILAALRKPDRTWQLGWISAATGTVTALRSLGWRFQENGLDLSPDGRYVAYSALPQNPSNPRPGIMAAPDTYVYVALADGTGPETAVVATAGSNVQPLWTSDGAHVLFRTDRAGTFGLWAVPVQNGKPSGAAEPLLKDIGGSSIGLTHSGGYYYSLSALTSVVSILPLVPGSVGASSSASIPAGFSAAWSPDGRSLALRRVSRRDGKYYFDFIVRSLQTGEERTFDPRANELGGADAVPPIWLHDGSGLLTPIFSTGGAGTGPLTAWSRLDLKTGLFTEVLPADAGQGKLAALTPDDRWLYVSRRRVADGSIFSTIAAFDLQSHQEQPVFSLPPMTSPRPTNPTTVLPYRGIKGLFLSPDARVLAFDTVDADGVHIWRVDRDGRNARELFAASPLDPPTRVGAFQDATPRDSFELIGWAPDGRSILFEYQSKVIRIPAEGGRVEDVGVTVPVGQRTTWPQPSLFLSHDGARLAMTQHGYQTEVWAVDGILDLLKARQER